MARMASPGPLGGRPRTTGKPHVRRAKTPGASGLSVAIVPPGRFLTRRRAERIKAGVGVPAPDGEVRRVVAGQAVAVEAGSCGDSPGQLDDVAPDDDGVAAR